MLHCGDSETTKNHFVLQGTSFSFLEVYEETASFVCCTQALHLAQGTQTCPPEP